MAARKLTTGLTGLAVATSPHHTLGVLYGKILRCLQKMPSDSAYRRYTEQIISDRNNHVKTEPDVTKLEKAINAGQIEEVIVQAEKELSLARKMLEWKAWEPLAQEPPKGQWQWPIK
ncbi:NADH dehydrogenase [ubiquinone] 1 alpha subcomplex subunit 5 [Penaeus vannamei]|uniref:NADH dehydrogenase n=1 Tax=Penaeus vannamei TaxID=6689 RepID=A0A3R7QEY9_PENVA|nr:NADH dehydrogenase [ubiquinone] 1 alpha subcomplex subunit 5-like [Penaeus vannamei]ROT65303.1 NADH dehydrogenase [Penaeus vannamei]